MTATLRSASPEATARDLPEGLELAGRYRVLGELARGGMGVVYLAEHLALGREVAIKTLHPRYLHEPQALERFEREARAAASIGHPGIVHVFDLGSDGGIAFLVMERLHGEDLRQRIASGGALPIELAVDLGVQLAAAIAAAHHRGIVHRDLSPRNVFLARDTLGGQSVKVLDFGIAKLTEPLLTEQVTQSHHHGLGTLMYMAPERVANASSSGPLVDVYAIGALLYEAITGATPYPTCAYHELALKVVLEQPVAICTLRAECPPAVAQVVERAMHKDPALRWPSAARLGEALREALVDPERVEDVTPAPHGHAPEKRNRSTLAALAALVVTALALGLVRLSGRERAPAAEAASSAQPRAVAAPVAPKPAVIVAASPEGPALAAPATPRPEPATPREQAIEVVTEPAGAIISTPAGASCRAPCELHLPADQDTLVRARLRGYRTRMHELAPPLPERLELKLERTEHAAPSAPAAPAPLPPLLPRR